jgi:hypothetical protein
VVTAGIVRRARRDYSVGVRRLSLLVAPLLLSGCSLFFGPATTTYQLTVQGYPVTCTLADTDSTTTTDPLSLCSARARDAIGTMLATHPNATLNTVTIQPDGSWTVCYTEAGAESCFTRAAG